MVERHMSRKKRLKAIWKIISNINDSWILWQVHRFLELFLEKWGDAV